MCLCYLLFLHHLRRFSSRAWLEQRATVSNVTTPSQETEEWSSEEGRERGKEGEKGRERVGEGGSVLAIRREESREGERAAGVPDFSSLGSRKVHLTPLR